MGLDISPGGAHWSYGGFADFRRKLAKEFDIELDTMEGFVADGRKWWDYDETVPIVPLLHHSDCDGTIGGWECEAMLPTLRLIYNKWVAENGDGMNYHLGPFEQLIEGMEHCAEHRCAMSFH